MPLVDFETGTWLNEPDEWSLDAGGLNVTSGLKTDFWQGTYYGFHHDDGHFFHVPAKGDFTASVTFEGAYEELYDQAGLMVRIDAEHWIKVGIEHSDGVTNFSLVATRTASDWSVISQPLLSGPRSVRITRIGAAVLAHYRTAEGQWQLMRVCPFPATPDIMVGPMACSPQRAGFKARFSEFRIDPPIDDPLHG